MSPVVGSAPDSTAPGQTSRPDVDAAYTAAEGDLAPKPKRKGGGHGPTKAQLKEQIAALYQELALVRSKVSEARDLVGAERQKRLEIENCLISAREEIQRLQSQLTRTETERPTIDEVRALVYIGFSPEAQAARVLDEAKTFRELQVAVKVVKALGDVLRAYDAELNAPPAGVTAEAIAERNRTAAPLPERRYRLILTKVSDNVISAIKAVREVSNLGLKEAKDIVDVVVGPFNGPGEPRGIGREQEVPLFGTARRTALEADRHASILKAAGAEVRVEEIVALGASDSGGTP